MTWPSAFASGCGLTAASVLTPESPQAAIRPLKTQKAAPRGAAKGFEQESRGVGSPRLMEGV